MMPDQSQSPTTTHLPVTRGLAPAYAATLIVALLMASASVAGIVYQTAIYPTDELRRWFVLNDVLNLVAGLPLLLGSMWLARRNRLVGLLCWPGILFYALYVYIAYVIAVPFGALFLAHLLIATLSAYTIIGLAVSIDGEAVRQRLTGLAPVRTAGGILLGLALLTIARQLGAILTALSNRMPVAPQEMATWITDLGVMCPVLIVAGIQMWRRKALGYVAGAGLLLQFGILALGLVPGLMSVKPVNVAGIVIVLIMAAICLTPFAFFVRGAAT
jgi:hypothetical protein